MDIVRKIMLVAVISAQGILASAQNDMQKAFSESYTKEYKKEYTGAIAELTKVYDEKSYEINLRLGWLHYENKSYAQSQSHYQKAVNLKPYAIEAKLGLVKPLAVLESWDKVLQQYDEILKIDPQNTTANYWGGVTYYNRKKYETAAKMFERIVNLYPFDYDANHMLGWTYLSLGRSAEAKVLFNKALLSRPADASATSGLAKAK